MELINDVCFSRPLRRIAFDERCSRITIRLFSVFSSFNSTRLENCGS